MRNYKRASTSVFNLSYHLIWCPKYRRGLLVGDLKIRLEEIIKEAVYSLGGVILGLEIMPDHVHLCASLPPKIPIHKLLKLAKGRSSNYLRKEFPHLLKMPTLWSRSYFATTVGDVSTEKVMEYIKKQWEKK